jgi:hypothetical protein
MPDAAGPILAATVAVPDLELGAAAYRALLDLEELASGEREGARWRVLGPPGGGWGLIRLQEAVGAPRPAPFRTLGWAAIEILVADADATAERCRAVDGFQLLQAPASVGGTSALRALQASGPGGEGLYLTQVNAPARQFRLPALAEGRHRVFVVVAGTPDVEATRGHFESQLGASRVTDHPLPVKVLNQAYALPPGTLHRISTVQLAASTLIEIDEYPPAAEERPPGWCGVISVTFAGPRPEGLGVVSLPSRSEPPYSGAAAWAATGPFGLRYEVVES